MQVHVGASIGENEEPSGNTDSSGNSTGNRSNTGLGKGKRFVLQLTDLQHAIEGARYKKKSDQFVLCLKKAKEQAWYALRRKSSA